jgi:hypothetical protein
MRGLLQIQMDERFFKMGSYLCALILKPSRRLAKGKLKPVAKLFCLRKHNINFNGI